MLKGKNTGTLNSSPREKDAPGTFVFKKIAGMFLKGRGEGKAFFPKIQQAKKFEVKHIIQR